MNTNQSTEINQSTGFLSRMNNSKRINQLRLNHPYLFDPRYRKDYFKLLMIGQHTNDGILFKLIIYAILLCLSVLYLNPLFYMFSVSLQSVQDLVDPSVLWFPTEFIWENYFFAFHGLEYVTAIQHTLFISVGSAVLQVFSCAITGYAFARMQFPLKNFWFFVVLLTFLIPPQIMAIPLYALYANLGWLHTPWPFLVPALFSQGIKGALFIIIFRQFFAGLPMQLEESAKIDGAGPIRTYFKIMFPLAKPAMLVVFILSFVWHWNDEFHARIFLNNPDFLALSLQMQMLQIRLNIMSGDFSGSGVGGLASFDMTEPLRLAALVLIILPPLVLYMFLQRYFMQGIERSGLTGE